MVGQGTIKSSSSIIVSKLVGSPYPFYVLHATRLLACWHVGIRLQYIVPD